MTALRIAKGIAGKTGAAFAVIDTEARSASKYADRFAFDVDNLAEKTVDHYIGSMNECCKAGYRTLVIDSLSHAWRELTDEVDRITQASGAKNTLFSWAKVNPKQKRFVEAILNFPGHLIVTMRSKTEWVIGEGKNGKIAPEKMGLAPEQGKGIEYEFDQLIELNQRHQATVTKDRTGKFQDAVIDKPGEDFGVSLYEWLAGGVSADAVPQDARQMLDDRSRIIQEIGAAITSVSEKGVPYFSEEDKAEARAVIRSTPADDEGFQKLCDFKLFLLQELAKKAEHAA